MNTQVFWRLIEETGKKEDDIKKTEFLTDFLAGLNDEDIFSFHDIFYGYFKISQHDRLFAAANIIYPDCTDDMFDGFCSWLIFQGRNAFFGVMAETEYLVELCRPGGDFLFPQGMQISYNAFFKKHGVQNDYNNFRSGQEIYGLTPLQKAMLEQDMDFDAEETDSWSDSSELEFILPRLYQHFNE